MRIFSFLCMGIILLSGCNQVKPFQPNVPQGGRAVSIAVNPNNGQQIVVASETGGLFSTNDGGITWQHVDGLKNFGVNDVAYAPTTAAVNLLVATASNDFTANDNGFIWRSSDTGQTWSQPAGSIPPPSPSGCVGSGCVGCPERPSAHGVSFENGTGTLHVYVASNCGLMVSSNAGVTWTINQPLLNQLAPNQHNVNAVLAQPGGRVNVSTAGGLFSSSDAGNTWTPAAAGAPSFQGSTHSFAASPFNSGNVFFAGGNYQVFLSTDPGNQQWTQIPAPGGQSKAPFVRTAHSVSGQRNQFDLYYGTGDGDGTGCIFRQTFTVGSSGQVGSGTWTPLGTDHCDTNDVAFDVRNGDNPVLLATDGGVHVTTDQGASWNLSGSGPGGYDALQIAEVTGTSVPSSIPFLFGPHLDLYYATQDNDDVASGDGGRTWRGICCEGWSLQTPRDVPGATSSYTVTGVAGFGGATCGVFFSGPLFANCMPWPNPPTNGPIVWAPYYLLSPGHYIQETQDSNTAFTTFWVGTSLPFGLWTAAFPENLQVWGRHPFVAGPSSNPTVYEAVILPGMITGGLMNIGLIKATNLFAGNGLATVSSANGGPTTPLGSLGQWESNWSWYLVFAVDPNNADHLIAADVEENQMKISTDGGQNWIPDGNLTDLVTNHGAYDFRMGQDTLASSVAFDPYDSCHILVGTRQNGIIRSTDGANSWQKISGSEVISNVSSFFFPHTGPIIVSSYGRGLWELDLQRRSVSCTYTPPRPPTFRQAIVDPKTGARVDVKELNKYAICSRCMYVVVMNGAITDVKLEDSKIMQVSLSGGSIHQFDASKKEVSLQIPNVYSPIGSGVSLQLQAILKDKTPVRGLIVEGNTLKGIIVSQAQLPFQPPRIPYIHVLAGQGGGIPATEPGGEVTVLGEGFAPSTHGQNPLRILLANQVVANNVAVAEDGTFRAKFEARQMPGDYLLAVEQKEAKRMSLERTYVKVATQDRPMSNKRKSPA